jgi:hypothetical protein
MRSVVAAVPALLRRRSADTGSCGTWLGPVAPAREAVPQSLLARRVDSDTRMEVQQLIK